MDAKDVIGMTPLHHSLSMHSNDISFEIAKARRGVLEGRGDQMRHLCLSFG